MMTFFEYFKKTIAFLIALTVFFILLGIIISFSFNGNSNNQFIFKEGDSESKNKIIYMELRGPILNEPSDAIEISLIDSIQAIYVSEFVKNLSKIKIEKPKGIIISINSPGGSVSATYNLYKAINKYKKNNDTKIFLHTNELLASGGYWAALASDKIFANYGSMIGSLGVRGPDWIYYDNPISISSGILGQTVETKDGIKKFTTIAGKSKDLFNSFRKPTKEEITILQSIVDNIYDDFVNIISKNRNIEKKIINEKLGALIFDAKTAKENFLIDDIKNIEEVKKQMIKELNLENYQIIWKEKKGGLVKNLINSSLIIKYDIHELKNKKICKLINNYINVMILNNEYINNC